MINPNKITNFKRTEAELEEFILFCVLVAGKNSDVQAKKLDEFLLGNQHRPFDFIRYSIEKDTLRYVLETNKIGQYNRITQCFEQLVNLGKSLKDITLGDLLLIKGIGPKTARFFMVHSRKDCNFAILDTHILTWMRKNGCPAPKTTPSGQAYIDFEGIFLDMARKLWPNKSIAEIDLEIWKQRGKA